MHTSAGACIPLVLPVKHVPVGLDEDAHEEGVIGAGCQVGAAGGRVPGVEVI